MSFFFWCVSARVMLTLVSELGLLVYTLTTYSFSCLLSSAGVDVKKIDECIGDTEADVDNPILKAEQATQV